MQKNAPTLKDSVRHSQLPALSYNLNFATGLNSQLDQSHPLSAPPIKCTNIEGFSATLNSQPRRSNSYNLNFATGLNIQLNLTNLTHSQPPKNAKNAQTSKDSMATLNSWPRRTNSNNLNFATGLSTRGLEPIHSQRYNLNI